MLYSLNGYSKIITITPQNYQLDFDKLENLNHQIQSPKYDGYFHPSAPKDFRIRRYDFCKTREESNEIISKWSFSLWDKFKLVHCPTIITIINFQKHNQGLLYSTIWRFRRFLYNANNEEFFAYHLHPEDINFDTDFYKESRIQLTIVYNNIKYIIINAFDFMTIGDLLDSFLKYPIWSKFYSIKVQDNSHEFDLFDFSLRIKYFVEHSILHDGSIILIQKRPYTRYFLF